MPACLQVERLLDVYREQGPAQLETYVVPLLGWEELQTIKREAEAAGDSPAALPASSSAPLALPSSGGNGSGEEGASAVSQCHQMGGTGTAAWAGTPATRAIPATPMTTACAAWTNLSCGW